MRAIRNIIYFGVISASTVWASDPKPAEHGAEKKEAKPGAKAEHGAAAPKAEAKPAAKSEHGAAPKAEAKGHGEAPKTEAKAAAKAEHGEAKPAAAHAEAKPAVEPKRTAPAKPVVHAAAPKPKAPVKRAIAPPAAHTPIVAPAIMTAGAGFAAGYVLVPAASYMASQGVIPIQVMPQQGTPQMMAAAADGHSTMASISPAAAPELHSAPHRLAAAGPPVVTAEVALNELKKGNERHVDSDYNHDHHSHRRLEEVAKGQAPHAIILTCSDSSVPPELVFDKGLGDLFVIRVAGNVAGNSELASIEYAAEHLNVPLVIVMGHKRCGAVSAAVAGGDPGGHITALVKQMEPAVKRARNLSGDLVDNAVHTNVDQVVRDLRNSAPILRQLVEAGRLKVLGAYYDLDSGKLEWMY